MSTLPSPCATPQAENYKQFKSQEAKQQQDLHYTHTLERTPPSRVSVASFLWTITAPFDKIQTHEMLKKERLFRYTKKTKTKNNTRHYS